jgi:hypothetical protein
MYHDRTAWRYAFFVGKIYGCSKGYPQRNAAHMGGIHFQFLELISGCPCYQTCGVVLFRQSLSSLQQKQFIKKKRLMACA